jgi:hypothetical protein
LAKHGFSPAFFTGFLAYHGGVVLAIGMDKYLLVHFVHFVHFGDERGLFELNTL